MSADKTIHTAARSPGRFLFFKRIAARIQSVYTGFTGGIALNTSRGKWERRGEPLSKPLTCVCNCEWAEIYSKQNRLRKIGSGFYVRAVLFIRSSLQKRADFYVYALNWFLHVRETLSVGNLLFFYRFNVICGSSVQDDNSVACRGFRRILMNYFAVNSHNVFIYEKSLAFFVSNHPMSAQEPHRFSFPCEE